VGEVVGDLADVEVIMPLGADPHDFAPSAKQAEAMEDADLLVVNGAGFEEGMDGVIDSVTDGGTPVYVFADSIELLDGAAHDDDHTDEATHEDEATHTDEATHEDDHGAFDPHLWTDPARMVEGVRGLGAALAAIDGVDSGALDTRLDDYVGRLEALDTEIEAALDAVPADDRVLVTNHEVFGYFADRYGFEIVGAVVPSLSTNAETSSRELEDLAAIITAEGIPAIFAETTQSTDLADALADEVGGEVAVVELFTESLGEPGSGAETYIDLMRTNAERIVAALTGA
jgi:zinc/manganese transport system substrate-binding protein